MRKATARSSWPQLAEEGEASLMAMRSNAMSCGAKNAIAASAWRCRPPMNAPERVALAAVGVRERVRVFRGSPARAPSR
jgi:hypothetical protein